MAPMRCVSMQVASQPPGAHQPQALLKGFRGVAVNQSGVGFIGDPQLIRCEH